MCLLLSQSTTVCVQLEGNSFSGDKSLANVFNRIYSKDKPEIWLGHATEATVIEEVPSHHDDHVCR